MFFMEDVVLNAHKLNKPLLPTKPYKTLLYIFVFISISLNSFIVAVYSFYVFTPESHIAPSHVLITREQRCKEGTPKGIQPVI